MALHVAPVMVRKTDMLAQVRGSFNAIQLVGDVVGETLFQGPGAGMMPTASSVVADLIDIARGEVGPAFAMPVASLADAGKADAGLRVGRYYLRFTVADRPGVLAEITAAMRDAGVSIESLIQRGEAPDGGVLLVMTTHICSEMRVTDALKRLDGSPSLVGRPMLMPILDV